MVKALITQNRSKL